MGKELEVKVLNIDKEDIINKLESIGAKKVKNEYQINTIFDNENRDIFKNHNGYLRIRETRNLDNNERQFIFTLKKTVSKDGVRENIEHDTIVDNDEALINILSHLDLSIKHKGTKERISYEYENILFEIDTWDKETYPNPYLEIEVKDKGDLERAIKLLELNENNVTTKSLKQLRLEVGLGDL